MNACNNIVQTCKSWILAVKVDGLAPGASASLEPIDLRPQCILGCAILHATVFQPHYLLRRAIKRAAIFLSSSKILTMSSKCSYSCSTPPGTIEPNSDVSGIGVRAILYYHFTH